MSFPELRDAFAACEAINRAHGKSYFFATRFFDAARRDATHALYAFFRVPDDIVDVGEPSQAAVRLGEWERRWHEALAAEGSEDPVLHAAAHVFRTYDIPPRLAEEFLSAMRDDLTKTRYETYEELRAYMHGSAAAVGLMMTHVIGFDGPQAFPHAIALGEAMQLTNFVRDVGEDLRDRGRVYLPQEDLRAAGATDADLARGQVTPAIVQLLRAQIARSRDLYRLAEPGMAMLHPRGRYAVRLASRLYEAILVEIERNGYDVFSRRARTSSMTKLRLAFDALIPRT